MFPAPSWLLLVWSGLVASLAAGAVIAPLTGSSGPRGTVYFFRPAGFLDFVLLVLLGLVIYPAVYGLIFDLFHVASAISGSITGAVHALILIAASAARRLRPEKPAMTILLYVAYGAVLGFLYITP